MNEESIKQGRACIEDLVGKIIAYRQLPGSSKRGENVVLVNIYEGMRWHLVQKDNKTPNDAMIALNWFFQEADLLLLNLGLEGLRIPIPLNAIHQDRVM